MGTNGNTGMMQGTNAVLTAAGAKAQVVFLNYNDAKVFGDKAGPARQYGDIRYNFFRWVSSQDVQDTFAGVTMPGFDPRTGEIVNEGIEFNDFAIKDFYIQRIDAFLTSVGAGCRFAGSRSERRVVADGALLSRDHAADRDVGRRRSSQRIVDAVHEDAAVPRPSRSEPG